jgi:catechol 2,3-dioxygenase-like lactoylglutathione lyase family enzyme
MIRNEPIIGVADVAKSARWYRELFSCKSLHGGDTFEMLADENETIFLCLHKWGEHEHPTISDPDIPVGNGLILYFRTDELDRIWQNAVSLHAVIEQPRHVNPNSGEEEFALRDPDGYYLIVSE